MLSQIRPAIVATLFFTLLLGVIYPLVVTGIAQVAFPAQAGGSLIRDGKGEVIGSALLAQSFAKPQYLHPRPSAAGTGPAPSGCRPAVSLATRLARSALSGP
jgi:K+-transporting ATPase ATPase C chain